MKRLTVTCAAALALLAGSNADAQVTMKQAQSMIENGQARKLPEGFLLPEGEEFSADLKFPQAARNMRGVPKPTNPFELKSTAGKDPMRLTAGGADVCGLVIYSDDHEVIPYGLWSIEASTLKCRWVDMFAYDNGYHMRNGFYMDDKIVGNALYSFMGYIFGYYRVVLDYFTGDLIEQNEYDYTDHDVLIYSKLDYNSKDGFVYGVVMEDDGSNGWYRTSPSSFDSGERISDMTKGMTSLCYCSKDGNFYGFNSNGYLMRIEPETGKYTNVLDMNSTAMKNISFSAMSSIVWSPVENVFYASLRSDAAAYLFKIDLAEMKVLEPISIIPEKAQFSFMITSDSENNNNLSPLPPTYVSSSFPDGSTTGTVDFRMPTETIDGTKIEGTLYAFPSVNSVAVGPEEGYTAQPGEVLTVNFTDVPEGTDSFKMYVLSDKGRSRTAEQTIFVGNDYPLAPKNVTLKENKVSWTKVRAGVNGGYLATGELVYKVYVNGEFVGETSSTSLEFDLDMQNNYFTVYQAEVTCECRGKVSQPGVSNSIKVGKPLELPMTIIPDEEQDKLTTIINPGNDKAFWWLNDPYGFMLGSYVEKGNDDWIILPPFNATSTDKYYTLTFEATRIEDYSFDEFLSVFAGTEATVEAMTVEVLGEFTPTTAGRKNEYERYAVLFKAPAEGACYLGFHGRSTMSDSGLIFRNINVFDSNVTDESPTEVLNLDAQPLESGVLKATVSFNMPRKTVGGENIAKDADLKVTVKSEAQTLVLSGAPGERISTEIETVQGQNILTVMPGIGDLGSLMSEVVVYTGVVPPVTPKVTGLTVSPDMQTMTLKWDPVYTGVDNGPVDPDDIQYVIYKQVIPILGSARWEKFAEVGKETSFVYHAETDYPDYVLLGVASVNAAGENGSIAAAQGLCGTPYVIPMSESFERGLFQLSSWSSKEPNADYKIVYTLDELAPYGDFDTDQKYALVGIGEVGDKGRLAVPRFSTENLDEAFFSCNIYTGKNASPITLYAGYTGAEKLIEFGKIEPNGSDFSDVTFTLPKEAMGKLWVQIYMDTEFTAPGNIFVLQSVDVTDITGVSSASVSEASVIAGNGMITVNGCAGKTVTVNSINGFTMVRDIPVANTAEYRLAKGIYIVSVGDRKMKVAVK